MKKVYLDFILLIGTIAMLFSGYLIYNEVHGAKVYCGSIEGNYTLKFYPLPVEHLCNNRTLVQYGNSWEFKGERVDLSNLVIELPWKNPNSSN